MILAENNKIVKIDGLYYNLDEQHQTAEVIGMSGSSIIDVQDKSIAEWNLLPAECVFETKLPQNASYQGLKSVKVYVDNTYINLLVEPDPDVIVDLEWVPFHVYINTDNSDATGGYGDQFADPNADVLLEGAVFGNKFAASLAEAAISYAPCVCKWWGEVGGSGWQWTDPSVEHTADDNWGAIIGEGELEDCASQFVDGKIEIKINRSKIPATWNDSEFGIGFDIDQNWSAVGILPQVSPTDENPHGLAHKLQVKIDNNSYADGETVNNLVIPATVTDEDVTYNVTRIGEKAFLYKMGLTSVAISEGVKSIGAEAFYGCTGIKSATIPETVTEIGSRAFSGCNITEIRFTGNIEQWCNKSWRQSDLSRSYNLFIQGKKIKDLALSANVGNYAFQGCNSLRSVTIADEVTSIGEGIFAQCSNLKSVVIGNGITKLEYGTFHTCTALRDVTLPNSLTEIGSLAFADCQNLESIVIPNNVRTIGESAFISCFLEDIVFGSNLKIIETAAFMYNGTYDQTSGDYISSIKSVTCYSMRPPTARENTFYGMPYTTPVYVPADYLTYYQVHDIWGLYDVRPLGATSEETDKVDIETSTTSAEVVWPAVEGAETYELVIKDKQGNVICTLIFNANGQLTSIVFSAPARDNATEQTQEAGFSFTVTGLESSTTYDLTITAKDSNDQILQTTSQTFTTAELTGVEDIVTNISPTKLILGGQLLILRGDKTYTIQGQEVR